MPWRPPSRRLWWGSLPTVVEPFAALAYDLLAIWSIAMVLLAGLRRRWLLGAGAAHRGPHRGRRDPRPQRQRSVWRAMPASFCAGRSTGRRTRPARPWPGAGEHAARELSRPFRTTTHRLAVPPGSVPSFCRRIPYRVLCGVLAAGVAAGLVRVAFGTPRTTVSASDVRLGLLDLGVEAEPSTSGMTACTRRSEPTAHVSPCPSWAETSGTHSSWSGCGGSLVSEQRKQPRRSWRLQLEHQALLLLSARSVR